MADLEQMKAKYASVLNFINQNGVRLSHVHIQDNKLFVQGAAGTEAIKDKVWDQVKLVDPSFSDLTLDITVDASLAPAPEAKTYTVAPGDSLSKIAKHFYGDVNQYMKIFEANKNILSDPNTIKVGQVLVIPD